MTATSYRLFQRKSLADLTGCDRALILSVNSVSEFLIDYGKLATHRRICPRSVVVLCRVIGFTAIVNVCSRVRVDFG